MTDTQSRKRNGRRLVRSVHDTDGINDRGINERGRMFQAAVSDDVFVEYLSLLRRELF
jgi:hypothetical protein